MPGVSSLTATSPRTRAALLCARLIAGADEAAAEDVPRVMRVTGCKKFAAGDAPEQGNRRAIVGGA